MIKMNEENLELKPLWEKYTSEVGETETPVVYTNTSKRFGSPIIVISLAPKKICSYDCIYCYGGLTKLKTNNVRREDTYPLDFITENLEDGFKSLSKKALSQKQLYSALSQMLLFILIFQILLIIHLKRGTNISMELI